MCSILKLSGKAAACLHATRILSQDCFKQLSTTKEHGGILSVGMPHQSLARSHVCACLISNNCPWHSDLALNMLTNEAIVCRALFESAEKLEAVSAVREYENLQRADNAMEFLGLLQDVVFDAGRHCTSQVCKNKLHSTCVICNVTL